MAVDVDRPAYRTIGAVLALAVLNAAAGIFCALHASDFTAKMFDTFSYTSLGYATLLVVKVVGEFAAGGTGLKGIVKTLLTEAKPGETAK